MAHVVAFRKTPTQQNFFQAARLSNRTELDGTAYKSIPTLSDHDDKRTSHRSVLNNPDYGDAIKSGHSQSNLFGTKSSLTTNQLLKDQFDKFAHAAPKFDVKGFEQQKKPGSWITQNLLSATDLKIPDAWTQIGRSSVDEHRMTQQKLIASRKEQRQPDKTFDLDNDGCVSQKDFKISIHFDKDKDGRLNSQERARAQEAIASGEAELLWKPPLKKGSLLDSKPFSIQHESSTSKNDSNHVRTQTELQKRRKEEKVSIYQLQYDEFQKRKEAHDDQKIRN